MLNSKPYYWQIIRKNVIAVGNIFKDIFLVKYNANNRNEIDRRVVNLKYSGKENYITRLLNTPDLPASVEYVLPGMSYCITGLAYDPTRKLQSGRQNFTQNPDGSINTQYIGVPYNLDFELDLYIRNIDDGLQIIEQILPVFNPDYTVTINYIDLMGITQNAPLVLNNVSMPNDFEGAADDKERRLIWTLNFTMQTNFYGPIANGNIIRQTITDINYLSTGPDDQENLILSTANTSLGNFALGETVYQGPTISQATAIGSVVSWNPTGGQLVITVTSGIFGPNANVYGVNYGSTVEILSVPQTLTLAQIINNPVPNTATSIEQDFGFETYIQEFPNIVQVVPPPSPSSGNGASFITIPTVSGSNSTNTNSSSSNVYTILSTNTLYINAVSAYTSTSGSTTVNETPIVIDSFPSGLFNSVKYIIQLSQIGGIHTTELLAIQDGTQTFMTEYATLMSTTSLGTFSCNLSGTNFNLWYTPNNPSFSIVTYKIIRQAVTT